MPELLRDIIVRALAQAPDVEMVGTTRERPPIKAARETGADVIVVAGDAEAPSGVVESLLADCPQASVVVVVESDDDDADVITRFELWPREVDFGEPSKERLMTALRGVTPWAQRLAAPERHAP